MNIFTTIKNTISTIVGHKHQTYISKQEVKPVLDEVITEDITPSNFVSEADKRKRLLIETIGSESSAPRIAIINQIHAHHKKEDSAWQFVPTPLHICEEMVDLLPINDEIKYVVLFNLEFLEVLITNKKVSPEQIFYIGDSKVRINAAQRLYDITNSVLLTKESGIVTLQTEEIQMELKKKDKGIVIIGNPPYQMPNDSGADDPIYNLFVELIIDELKPDYFTFITPSRWMSTGKGLSKFRKRMLSDNRIKSIKHFPISTDVFPDVDISGGVNYFLWEKNYSGACSLTIEDKTVEVNLKKRDILLLDLQVEDLISKIEQQHEKFILNKYTSEKPFGIASNFSDWKEEGIPCLKKGKEILFVSPNIIKDKHNIINKWKVCISKAGDASGKPDKNGRRNVVYSLCSIPPGTVCTQTYIIIHISDTENEAMSFSSYVKTKFFRFMLSLRATTQDLPPKAFAWVPDLQDYTKPWTDEELYNMFNLTQEERDYIESKIKPLN